jgi:hypothetical protein
MTILRGADKPPELRARLQLWPTVGRIVDVRASFCYLERRSVYRNKRSPEVNTHAPRSSCRNISKTVAMAERPYKAAYPAVKKDETADSSAARLLRYARVRERMKELQHAAARETGVTLNGLIEKLGETYTKATADKQHAAAVSAVIAQAKLAGIWGRAEREPQPRGDLHHIGSASYL